MIDAALLSAQRRKRWFWTNIKGVTLPDDKGILLKDVVLPNTYPVELDGLRGKQGNYGEGYPRVYTNKSTTLRTPSGGGNIPSLVMGDFIHSQAAIDYMNSCVKDGRTHWDFSHRYDVRNPKSATVVANFFKGVPYNVLKSWNCIRKFHPIECERLQGLRDNYTRFGVDEKGRVVEMSNTQRYKTLGNGFNVDVVAHILSFI